MMVSVIGTFRLFLVLSNLHQDANGNELLAYCLQASLVQ